MPVLRTLVHFIRIPVVATLLVGCTTATNHSDAQATAAEAPTLSIGSEAPAVDIEHWIQDGGGKYEPFKSFEDGKVYVVEFWATWCGPCIQSMPHLAELQQKHGDEVRIVSITDETLDEVDALMQQNYPNTGKTFEQVTAPYSLTADPDGSMHESYMRAAQIGGIPSAFLVGKTGLVEWIGHPMTMDDPIEAVLNDTWDREKEKQRRDRERRIEQVTRQMSMLARQGRYEDALELVQKQVLDTPDTEADEKDYWRSVVNSLKMSADKLDEDAVVYYREKIASMQEDPMSLIRFSFSLFDVADGGGSVGPLAKEADDALAEAKSKIEPGTEALFHYARALLNRIDDDFDTSIEQLTAAVDTAKGKQKERFAEALAELKEDAKKAAQPNAADNSEQDE